MGDACVGADVVPVGTFLYFIAQRPEDDGRIVAVTANDGSCGKFCPGHVTAAAKQTVIAKCFGKIGAEIMVVSVFRIYPSIEQFFDHKKSKFVANFNKIFVTWIMCDTDCIGSHIFHDLKLAIHGIIVSGRA